MAFKYWTSGDNKHFFPVANEKKIKELTPGVYHIEQSIGGFFFSKSDYDEGELLQFSGTVVGQAIDDIKKFWTKKDQFLKFKFPYKRGILLHGPPGSGKSSTVRLIINDIIKAGGIAVFFDDPELFNGGMNALRQIQPNTPVIVIMEDLDSIFTYYDHSTILNILDGITGFENLVFLATTNYLHLLQDRVKNRPSRFDRLFFVDFPSLEAREQYFDYLVRGTDATNLPLNKWAKDTQGFSIAHLKELFISMVVFENDYKETLARLKCITTMDSNENEDEDEDYEMENVVPPVNMHMNGGKT